MADPISIFPMFVENQVYPPTPIVSEEAITVVLESAEIAVTLDDANEIPVLLNEGTIVCFEE